MLHCLSPLCFSMSFSSLTLCLYLGQDWICSHVEVVWVHTVCLHYIIWGMSVKGEVIVLFRDK